MVTAAGAAGRDPGEITPGLFVSVAVTDTVESGRRLLEEFSQASYGLPVEQLEQLEQLIKLKPLLTSG